jgi:chromosome partitioning protein
VLDSSSCPSGGSGIPRQIAFINEKGGSCKTTLTSCVGDYLARERGLRVLLVDLDPQGQLGKVFGIDVGAARKTALDLLLDAVIGPELRPAIPIVTARHPRLDLVPSNKSLALFPQEIADHGGEEYFYLRDALQQCRDYDFILLDAPPSFGVITLNALLAASEIVLPVPLTYLALDGAAEITRTVEMVRTRFNHPGLQITMVVPTFARPTKMAEEILEVLRHHFPKQLSETVMGYSVLVDQAQSRGQTILEYAPRCNAARWMRAVGDELLTRDPARARA